MPLLDVGYWPGSIFDAIQEVLHMASNCRGDMLFQVFFGFIFRELFELESDIAMNRLGVLVAGNEIEFMDARF